jgi:hypothetical protein
METVLAGGTAAGLKTRFGHDYGAAPAWPAVDNII